MKFTATGAARQVTGSRHLLEIGDKKILLDCGMQQGHRKEADKHNRNVPFDATKLDCVILSHAHIDHCGLLPVLVKAGFTGPIFTTAATKDITNLMLMDSGHIAESDAEHWKKRNPKKPPIDPLFTQADVPSTMSLFKAVPYHYKTEILPGISLTFHDAGHILGSALTFLEFEENDQPRKLLFTGDLGRPDMPIIKDPETIPETDILITESTYGDRLHEDYSSAADDLAKIISETAAQGGKILVPSFALERTQELIWHLHLLHDQNKIPEIPIFIDSPLAINLTEIFKTHLEVFDKPMQQLWHEHLGNPFGFGKIKYTRTTDESIAISKIKGPAIIIAASGMVEAGRILHHLKREISNPKSTMLFVGFQVENTLGGRLVRGAKTAKIFGEEHPVKIQVKVLDAFSAHADYSELLAWSENIKVNETIMVVHGEETQAMAMRDKLQQQKPHTKIFIPKENETFEI